MLLERLCNENGVSGNEDRIRAIILEEIKPYVDEIKTDALGNIIALKKGKDHSKKVMIAAHMDEVGFIISGITEKGYLKFKTVGGIDPRVVVSKRVRVGDDKIPGIIGMKAIHLQRPSERESVPDFDDLTIDIGAKSKEEAKKKVSIGDYATFDTLYSEFGTDKIKAKALDDRVGCMLLIEALKHNCKYDLYACFTAQEEVGGRGAYACTFSVNPDTALILEGTTCLDVYKTDEKDFVTVCGNGPAITIMDSGMIADRTLREYLYNMAKENKIAIQYKKTTMGGTDASVIHKANEGIKSAILAIPCRYLHSPVTVASKKDIDEARKFVKVYLDNIGGIINGIA